MLGARPATGVFGRTCAWRRLPGHCRLAIWLLFMWCSKPGDVLSWHLGFTNRYPGRTPQAQESCHQDRLGRRRDIKRMFGFIFLRHGVSSRTQKVCSGELRGPEQDDCHQRIESSTGPQYRATQHQFGTCPSLRLLGPSTGPTPKACPNSQFSLEEQGVHERVFDGPVILRSIGHHGVILESLVSIASLPWANQSTPRFASSATIASILSYSI